MTDIRYFQINLPEYLKLNIATLSLTDGSDGGWKLPLPPLSASDVEPYGPSIDQGEVAARHEAALKV